MFGTWHIGESRPFVPIETFARFLAGFLSSEDFHCISSIFMDCWLLEGVIGFFALLEGGSDNVLQHARRSGEAGGLIAQFVD